MRKLSCLPMSILLLISGKLHSQTMELTAPGTSAGAEGNFNTRFQINNTLIISGIVYETSVLRLVAEARRVYLIRSYCKNV